MTVSSFLVTLFALLSQSLFSRNLIFVLNSLIICCSVSFVQESLILRNFLLLNFFFFTIFKSKKIRFPKTLQTLETSTNYLKKMVDEFAHLSILAAHQVGFLITAKLSRKIEHLLLKAGANMDDDSFTFLFISLKDLHSLFIQWNSIGADLSLGRDLAGFFHKLYSVVIKPAEHYFPSK